MTNTVIGATVRDLRWSRISPKYVWPFATGVAIAFGVYEGVIYQPPRIWIVYQWLILGALEWALLAGFIGWLRGLAFIPYVVALQDCFSIIAQGKDPVQSLWHQEFFGVNFLTIHSFGLPNYYYAFALLSFVLDFALDRWTSTAARTKKVPGQTPCRLD